MPEYVIHVAACTKEELSSEAFLKGVLAPDILKKWLKIYKNDINQVEVKYNSWKTKDMPNFSNLKNRIIANDDEKSYGLHYGYSNNPNFNIFFADPVVELTKPFWKGYFKHLLTDYKIYTKFDINSIFKIKEQGLTKEEREHIYNERKKTLHDDWDILNLKIANMYKILLPEEVIELNIVKFKAGNSVYIKEDIIINSIEELRKIEFKW